MRRVCREVLGAEVPLTNTYMGLDEQPDDVKQDYIDFRSLPRTPGYLERKKWFVGV